MINIITDIIIEINYWWETIGSLGILVIIFAGSIFFLNDILPERKIIRIPIIIIIVLLLFIMTGTLIHSFAPMRQSINELFAENIGLLRALKITGAGTLLLIVSIPFFGIGYFIYRGILDYLYNRWLKNTPKGQEKAKKIKIEQAKKREKERKWEEEQRREEYEKWLAGDIDHEEMLYDHDHDIDIASLQWEAIRRKVEEEEKALKDPYYLSPVKSPFDEKTQMQKDIDELFNN